MAHDLPPAIAAYVAANARLDAEGMLAAFAPRAVVLDDGGRHEGREEIKAWIRRATLDSRAVFSPKAWRDEDGRIVADGLTTSDFSGSPIRFTFRFRLEGGAIAALEIA
ncbi:nuclear transport factor 2 family protein (plasmid) [Azospirillum brasilense]|uniref:Nuclear transport factor 2 family protein n=1 Tax=Azospirillum brasilense TaxID=192 RepID=A0A4D8R3A1_AZOBR|nr:nuclear transport factor 2 family protein [Azospirillum brasilense]QCO17117.1 nuclear transport factor 2 family protein [Azospirillum brasilense]